MDRHAARQRIMLQQVEQHEAVYVGQAEIQRNGIRLQLAGHRQCAGTGRGHYSLQSDLVREIEQDRGEGRIVLDNQNEGIIAQLITIIHDLEVGRQRARDHRTAVVVARRRSARHAGGNADRLHWNEQGEGRSLTGPRLDLQLAAEQARDFAADR